MYIDYSQILRITF